MLWSHGVEGRHGAVVAMTIHTAAKSKKEFACRLHSACVGQRSDIPGDIPDRDYHELIVGYVI